MSRVMMFAMIDRRKASSTEFTKSGSPGGSPSQTEKPTSRFITYSGSIRKKTADSEGFNDEHENGRANLLVSLYS